MAEIAGTSASRVLLLVFHSGAIRALRSGMEIDSRTDQLTERIIGCGIAVHTALGPGLLESIYRDCLIMELIECGLTPESEVHVALEYRGRRIRDDLRLDLLVEGIIVVEVKSVATIHPVHVAQLITYLRLANKPAGLLLNFNTTSLRAGLRRADHPDIYRQKVKARTAAASFSTRHRFNQ